MTGTSARETSRPAKRQRPSAQDHSSKIAPPVLFRLPSISPACDDDRFGASAAFSQGSLATSGAAVSSAMLPDAPSISQPKPTHLHAGATASSAPALAQLAQKKAANQRLLNTIILALLLIALAIISVFAFRGGQPTAKPGLAGGEGRSQDQLDSLSDIRVPDISTSSTQSAPQPSKLDQAAAGQGGDANKRGSSTPTAVQPSLNKPTLTTASGAGLTMDAADLAKKPNAPAPQVQLGTPVPMRDGGNLAASKDAPSPFTNSGLQLTTPRYETVSTPSGAANTPSAGSRTDSGASPTLYDGAKKPVDLGGESNSPLMTSGANESEMSLIPSDYSGSTTKPTAAQPVSTNASAPVPSTPATHSADSLGVTVGAGMAEPEFPKAQVTATPDLDVAAISSQFLEYSKQKSAATRSSGTEILNPYAPATAPAGTSTPATTVATNAYTSGAYRPNPAVAGVPYGTTGTTLTPYVRNSPTSAVPSGMGNQAMPSATGAAPSSAMTSPNPSSYPAAAAPAQGAASTAYPSLSSANGYYPQASAPGGSAGYNAALNTPNSTASNTGFAIPPRGTSAAPTQMTVPTQTGSYGYAASQGYGPAATAGNYQPSAVTSTSPYPGGQAPQGMIGQSGFATAPSGDVVGRPPVPVTGTMGYSSTSPR